MQKQRFSKRSENNLATCHELLQKLFHEVIKHEDCTVLCGYRGEKEQEQAYLEGNSKLKFPESKHNQQPSLAVDVVPYPIDWKNTGRFYFFAGMVKGIAAKMGIPIRCGAEWESFLDLPHFELILEKK